MNPTEINQQTQKILNDFFNSVTVKDAESIASLFSDTLNWNIPKSEILPWTGKITNRSGIINALNLLFEAHTDGEDRLEIDHVFIDGNQAAVFGEMSRLVKTTGKRFLTSFCQRFTIENGKITRFLMLEDTLTIEKAFLD